MPSAFTLTVIFIIVTTLLGACIKGRSRDRCLLDFGGFPITVEMNSGKLIWGRLSVEPTGIELLYEKDYFDKKDRHIEKSYIIYKSEFASIEAVVRYHDTLDPALVKKRDKILKRYYHPNFIYPVFRKTRNVYYTIRDAAMEVTTLIIGRFRTQAAAGAALKGQDKYVSQIQQQVMTAAYSYEPLLEKYIGKKVVFKMKRGEAVKEYAGILKDYTPDFMEMLDVEYKSLDESGSRTADIIMSRQLGTVRHQSK